MIGALLAAVGVQLAIDLGCPALDAAEVRRIATMELRGQLAEGESSRTHVLAECSADSVRLRVDDRSSGRSLERTLKLADSAPPLRERLVALAIAELVVASQSQSQSPNAPRGGPASAAEAGAALAVEAPPRDAAAAVSRMRFLAQASLAVLGGPLVLYGGGVRFVWEPLEVVGLEAELVFDHGTYSVGRGPVSVDRPALSLAVNARLRRGAFVFRGLAGLAGGAVWFGGDPRALDGAAGVRPWLGALAGAAATMVVLGGVSVDLRVEGGWSIVSVAHFVEGASQVGVTGPWLGLRLGAGWGR